MKKLVLGAGLALLLTACGSPTPPTVPPTTEPQKPVVDAPPDATASQEFTFDRKQSRALLASLNLGPLDTVDLGNRLRVVLSITQAKSGASAGQKRASAVFIWGNQHVNLTGNFILGLSRAGEDGTLKSVNGKMNLAVTSPDYQAKLTKNTAYSAEDSALCATLTFNLKADTNTWESNLPVRVCEQRSSRQVEQDAITQAAAGVYYRVDSLGISKVNFVRLSSAAQTQPTTLEDVRRGLNLPNYTEIKLKDWNEFHYTFYSEPVLNRNDLKQEKKARKLLKTLYNLYGYNTRAFAVRETAERERILFVGWNRLGIAGIEMYRFTLPGQGNPGYQTAKTYGSLWRAGGSVVGWVQVGPHDPAATITGRYAVRQATTCAAGVNVTLDKGLTFDQTFPVGKDGLTSTQFTIEALPDTGQDVVVDYALTVNLHGQAKTYSGVMCDILTPPPAEPPPSVNDVEVFVWFTRHEDAGLSLSQFDGSIPFWEYQGSMTASGSYRVENAPECGAARRETLSGGPLQYTVVNAMEFALYNLELPGSAMADVSRYSRLVYRVTLTGQDGPRVIEGAKCIDWEDWMRDKAINI